MKDHADEKPEAGPDMVLSGRHSGFKKKSSKNHVTCSDRDYFKGLYYLYAEMDLACNRKHWTA